VRIQRADLSRLDDVAPLFDAYRAFFAGGNTLDVSTRFLGERLAANENVIFVADSAGAANGFIQLYPLWSSWHCSRVWFLSDLYVAENARRLGVGSLLVETVKEFAAATKASSVMVELPRREPHLETFYARLGFNVDSVFELARYLP
jgi:GNAT superfamily N-acetyltransferase